MTIETLTINDLRTKTANTADIYYTTDLGQEGEWYYDAADNTTLDNTGTIITSPSITDPTNTTTRLVFRRIIENYVNVKWFGAIGNRIADDTVAIQNALNFISDTVTYSEWDTTIFVPPAGNTLFIPKGVYRITETLIIGYNCKILGVNNRAINARNFNTHWNAGTVIQCDFDDKDKWAISTASLLTVGGGAYNPWGINSGSILPYNKSISAKGLQPPLLIEPKNTYLNFTLRLGIWIEGIAINGLFLPNNQPDNLPYDNNGLYNAFGGIRLANAPNSTVRNVLVTNTKVGIMLNTSWYATIEDCFVSASWYGAVVIDCNFAGIISTSLQGEWQLNTNYETLIEENQLPDFIYQEQSYDIIGLNNDVKLGKTAVYAFGTELSIVNTSVEQWTNGFTFLNCITIMDGCYTETIQNYSVTVGLNDNVGNTLVVSGFLVSNSNYGFLFGHNSIADLVAVCQSVYEYSFPYKHLLFDTNNGISRNITFSKTTFVKRKYTPDILFSDEGESGQNYGSVYVDPINGNDDNYGFNKKDAIKTFDAALIRVQNQSTINPIRTIYIKAAPLIHEGSPTVFAAIKNLNIVSIQNADILITTYDTDDQHVRGRIYFDGDPSGEQIAMIGQIELLGNVNLYFRNVDLITNDAQLMTANPVNLSMFGLTNAYSKVTFEVCNKVSLPPPFQDTNIYVNFCYFLFQANNSFINATRNDSLLDVKFINIVLSSNSTFFVSAVNLSPDIPIATAILGVDCVQISSLLPIPNYSLPNRGWNNATIIRNNF